MQIRIRGTKNEVEAMREWLPLLFCVVEYAHITKENDGPFYQLDADVHPLRQSA
jgi:hypothetical protein